MKGHNYKIVVSPAFCLICFTAFAQVNLVPNPSFEIFDTCPNTGGQVNFCKYWSAPTVGTSDYFNACASSLVGVPNNAFGFQNAKSGVAYMGLYTYFLVGNNYREYIEAKLISPLKMGKKYNISFFVSFACGLCDTSINYCWVPSNQIGAYFSNSYISRADFLPFSFTPQVNNSPSRFLSDFNNWTKILGSFIAQGGEEYITIGNFKDDANTDTIWICQFSSPFSYYYIDDISVIEDSLIIPNVFTPNYDGINDVFEIKGLQKGDIVKIFNRWGTKIFETSDPESYWDGRTTTGQECSAGIYYYSIVSNNQVFSKGFIHLMR